MKVYKIYRNSTCGQFKFSYISRVFSVPQYSNPLLYSKSRSGFYGNLSSRVSSAAQSFFTSYSGSAGKHYSRRNGK